MAATRPAIHLANLLSLPARHFAVVDAGRQRARILTATVTRGQPRLLGAEIIDAHEEGFTTPEELREEVRRRLRENPPEAVVLVLPQHHVLRHVLDAPPGDAAATRALVEREATRIGGLSESPWVFDSVRLRPFGGISHPLAADYCRRDDLQQLLESFVQEERLIYDVRPAADSLAAAFAHAAPEVSDAILVDLGAQQTTVTLVLARQPVFASAFPSGSAALTEALAADRGGTAEAAEVLKRTEPLSIREGASRFRTALVSWLAEVERTVQEWQAENPGLATGPASIAYLAGGGALQPGLADALTSLGSRRFEPWPSGGTPPLNSPDLAAAWGALLLSLGLAGPAPSLLPPPLQESWKRQRFWRALLSVNVVLIGLLAVAIALATGVQLRQLAARAEWRQKATASLQDAREIRAVAEQFNIRMESFRPLLERQRHTVETLQVLRTLQQQRTNASHWYVLLADEGSYSAGSNGFPLEVRARPSSAPGPTNGSPSRTFIAEVCLVPQGEQMRQALSELVGELKSYPLFRNVDVLPAERRRDLVDTNLIFPERHFALELNLAETELLSPIPLPRLAITNREPRGGFRTGIRDLAPHTNGVRGAARPMR